MSSGRWAGCPASAHRQHLAGRDHRHRPALHRDAVPPARFVGGQDPRRRAARLGRRAAHRGEGRGRARDRAPARHPASRRQTGEHPAHRVRRTAADGFRDRPDHRRVRDHGRARSPVHRRSPRPRCCSGQTPDVDLGRLQPGVDVVLRRSPGHAAFERRNGEQMVAQFLRITTHPMPNLRDSGSPDRRVRGDRAGDVPELRRTDRRPRRRSGSSCGRCSAGTACRSTTCRTRHRRRRSRYTPTRSARARHRSERTRRGR